MAKYKITFLDGDELTLNEVIIDEELVCVKVRAPGCVRPQFDYYPFSALKKIEFISE